MRKLEKLKRILRSYGSVLLAYSGGADSTFLLKVASSVLSGKVLAVTAVSATYPPEELAFARRMVKSMAARHRFIQTEELKDKRFIQNPANRCYFCKSELFRKLVKLARKEGLKVVVDASNVSDEDDFRPGSKARLEFGVRSPLLEAGFTKEDIQGVSKRLKLPTFNKPPLACLASRIPYGIRIEPVTLQRINKAENLLRRLGLTQVRLRHYNNTCRIEVPPSEMPRVLAGRDTIVRKLRYLGYRYVTLDLEGYRTGSMNEGLCPKDKRAHL
jgi:uncharacterized protein